MLLMDESMSGWKPKGT
jgi:hypothetical protein